MNSFVSFEEIMNSCKLIDKPVVVMFHNDCPEQEEEFDILQSEFESLEFLKVNTIQAPQIRNKYADGNSKPYFKFYRNGEKTDEVPYAKWWK